MKTFEKQLPRAIKLYRYEELASFIDGFVDGKLKLLFIIGRPGLGKSQMVQAALEAQRYAWLDCHATKMAMYFKLFQHRDEPIVIDDENSMLADSGKLDLLNALCQTNPVKTLRWDSTSRLLEERSVPTEFQTSSPVLIITNRVRVLGPQVRAMIDRGLPLLFQPSAATIHEAVANWFTDKEVYDFIGEWLPVIPGLSMRDYGKAKDLKLAGFDWRLQLHRQWKSGKLARVAALRADSSFRTEEDRVKAFSTEGSGSRASYFRYVERLRDLGVGPASEEPEPATISASG